MLENLQKFVILVKALAATWREIVGSPFRRGGEGRTVYRYLVTPLLRILCAESPKTFDLTSCFFLFLFFSFLGAQVHFEAAQIEERLASVCAKEVRVRTEVFDIQYVLNGLELWSSWGRGKELYSRFSNLPIMV